MVELPRRLLSYYWNFWMWKVSWQCWNQSCFRFMKVHIGSTSFGWENGSPWCILVWAIFFLFHKTNKFKFIGDHWSVISDNVEQFHEILKQCETIISHSHSKTEYLIIIIVVDCLVVLDKDIKKYCLTKLLNLFLIILCLLSVRWVR